MGGLWEHIGYHMGQMARQAKPTKKNEALTKKIKVCCFTAVVPLWYCCFTAVVLLFTVLLAVVLLWYCCFTPDLIPVN